MHASQCVEIVLTIRFLGGSAMSKQHNQQIVKSRKVFREQNQCDKTTRGQNDWDHVKVRPTGEDLCNADVFVHLPVWSQLFAFLVASPNFLWMSPARFNSPGGGMISSRSACWSISVNLGAFGRFYSTNRAMRRGGRVKKNTMRRHALNVDEVLEYS